MDTDGAGQPGKLTFALVCLSTLGNFVAQGLLYPALPLYLTHELDTSKAVAGLVVSMLALTSIAIRPWAGSFIDRVGRRPLLIAGPILATISAAGLLTFKFVLAVLVMRLIQGAGSAITYSSAVATVADVAPPEKRAGYLALFSTFFYVGFALGPFIAELLIESSGFSAVWWTVGGFTAFGAIVATFVRETRPSGLAAPPSVPILHRLFHPAARLPGMVFFCIGIGWTAIASFLSLYARDIGLSNSDVLFVALSISVLATRFIGGGLADRFGRMAVVVPSLVLVVAGMAGLALSRSPVTAVISLAVFGVGYSGGFPALLTMVVDRAPDRERGVAMSSFNVFFDIGAPVGGYGVGQLIDWGGFGLGFGLSAAAAAVALLFLPAMRRPLPQPAVVDPLGQTAVGSGCMDAAYEHLRVDTDGAVVTVTMHRPEVLNALNLQMGVELLDVLDRVDADRDVRCLVLTGAGRAFCAGDDLRGLTRPGERPALRADPIEQYVRGAGRWPIIVARMRALGTPVVAAVNGHAHGAGFNLALAADLRLMASSATLAVPFVRRGIATGTSLLQQYVGVGKAMEWALLAPTLDAAEAERWGLVTRVVPDDALATEAATLASALAAGPTRVYGYTKAAVYRGYEEATVDRAYEHQGLALHLARQTDDFTEGRTAFLEKRPPRFTGR